MKKIFSFSLLLILGLVASQILPGMLGESYPAFRAGATTFLYVCLSFIICLLYTSDAADDLRV